MNSTDDKEQAGQVQDAIISALGNAGDAKTQAAQTDILLNQMQKAGAGKKSRFLRILASVGGTKALQAVAGAFDKGDATEKEAALNALTSWADADAAPELYRIASEGSASAAVKALDGYINLVSKAATPPAQKLLQLRKAMEVARNGGQKARIIAEAQKTGTFLALVFRSEEHTSELQSLMRISYAVVCLKKTNSRRQYLKKKET